MIGKRSLGNATCWSVLYFIAMVFWPSSYRNGAVADVFGRGENTFEIDFVTIGDPGNAPDLDNRPNSYRGRPENPIPIGAVDYVYRMGEYEMSRGLVEKVNANSDLGITLFDMSEYNANGPERPATGITWFEAAHIVNWLNTSTGHFEAYKFEDGEFGLWEPSDAGYNPENPFRNRLAHYFLPSVDEFYKAAFYDGQSGVYYEFATGSNTAPTPVASGTAPETAIYHQRTTAPITQAGGRSPYGTMAQGGNVWEWEESEHDRTNNLPLGERGLRSGDWNDNDEHISASYRNPFFPWSDDYRFGFRVASIAVSDVVGDLNANGQLDAADIDLIVPGSLNLSLDMTGDGLVSDADRRFWVHNVASTWFGDIDLDGQFNSRDLVAMFQVGKYESDLVAGWAEGDFDGDQDFDSGDLVAAWVDGGYNLGARAETSALPEPAAFTLAVLGAIALLNVRRRRVTR
jgi:hypothetical protein